MANKPIKLLAADQGIGQDPPAATDAIIKEKANGQPSWCTIAQLIPAGGATGQALTKVDGTDYNYTWITPAGGGGGGGSGDMLTATYDPQNIAGDAFARSNHTGTQLLSTISDAGALASFNTVNTAQIQDDAVTLAKQAHGTANRLMGYNASGVPVEITAGTGISIAGAEITATGGGTGGATSLNELSDVTLTAQVDGEILQLVSGIYINRTLAEAGIAAAVHQHVLANITDAGALAALSTVDSAQIQDDAITLSKQAHGTADRLIGYNGTGVPVEVSAGSGISITGGTITATGGGGTGAPLGASYLVLSSDVDLTNERTLTVSGGLQGTDGGANGSYTISGGQLQTLQRAANISAGGTYQITASDLGKILPFTVATTVTVATGISVAAGDFLCVIEKAVGATGDITFDPTGITHQPQGGALPSYVITAPGGQVQLYQKGGGNVYGTLGAWAVPIKNSPVSADHVLGEDSENSGRPILIPVGGLGGGDGGGGGLTTTNVKTVANNNETLGPNVHVPTTTSGGAFTLNLPPSPSHGDEIEVSNIDNSWVSNALTLGRNGNTIDGLAENYVLDGGISARFKWNAAANGGGNDWDVVFTAAVSGGGGSGDATSLRGVALDGSVAAPSDGNVLVYRSAGSDWVLEPKPAGGSNPALADVTDVTLTAVADNEVLAYDQTSGDWINQTASEAGLVTADGMSGFVQVTDAQLSGPYTVPNNRRFLVIQASENFAADRITALPAPAFPGQQILVQRWGGAFFEWRITGFSSGGDAVLYRGDAVIAVANDAATVWARKISIPADIVKTLSEGLGGTVVVGQSKYARAIVRVTAATIYQINGDMGSGFTAQFVQDNGQVTIAAANGATLYAGAPTQTQVRGDELQVAVTNNPDGNSANIHVKRVPAATNLLSTDAGNTFTSGPRFWKGTQTSYEDLLEPDANTIYYITG